MFIASPFKFLMQPAAEIFPQKAARTDSRWYSNHITLDDQSAKINLPRGATFPGMHSLSFCLGSMIAVLNSILNMVK